MAYDAFVSDKPIASDNGNTVITDIRNNLMALRDGVTMGVMAGWNYSQSGGTADQPATELWSKGTERLRASLTWGTTGGADGNVTQAVWAYSSDSGSTWDTIGTETVTYDADSNVTATAWT